MTWVEALGYLASALIVASLAMRSVVRLRMVSFVGSVTFVVYGLLIGAWPVVISNGLIALINVWYLRKEFATKHTIVASELTADTPFLVDFLDVHASDIARSQPNYSPSDKATFIRLLSREGLPAGVVLGEPMGRELLLHLDYVIPAFRDSQIARWLYGPGRGVFTSAGFERLVAGPTTSEHRTYLEHVGFRPEGTLHVLDLTPVKG